MPDALDSLLDRVCEMDAERPSTYPPRYDFSQPGEWERFIGVQLLVKMSGSLTPEAR